MYSTEAAVDANERRQLFLAGASNTDFFARTFFPKTFRQESPPYAKQIYAISDDPLISHSMLLIYRGGSKTTQAKAILSKRISYAISRTMLLVSQSEAHSIRTLMWLKRQVERNEKWSSFYGLVPAMDKHTGRPIKWADNWICIHNKNYGVDIHIVAVGIEGQTRGLNIDDYRPDFILGDDVADDLNSGNPGPRQHVIDTWTGAIEKSLAPRSENPLAKIMLLQTPIAEGDIVDAIEKDPRYKVFRLGCFVTNPDGTLASAWPARFPLESLLLDKQAHITANKLRMWMREMELEHTDKNHQLLPSSWVVFDDTPVNLELGFVIVAVDPTPPPKLGQKGSLDENLDDTAVVAVFVSKQFRALLEYRTAKSPSTTWVIDTLFEFVAKWRPFKVAIETILFARTLSYDIARAQQERKVYFPVLPVEDRRAKPIRIVSEVTKYCVVPDKVEGKVVRPFRMASNMHEVYQQWIGYDGNPTKHDDIIDAISICFMVADQFEHLLDTLEGSFTVVGENEPLAALTFEDECP